MIFNYREYLFDGLALLVKLNVSRIWNFVKIKVSYLCSQIIKKPLVWAGPFSISFETSAICNLKCPECAIGTAKTNREQKLTPPALIAQKLKLHRKNAFYCNLYFQGEPFLHPQIFDIINHAAQNNYYSVISTNGHFLNEINCQKIVETRLNRLIVSLDGIDERSYRQYRKGGNFEKVIAGIRQISKTKKSLNKNHPLIIVQFLVNKTNEHQLKDAEKLVRDLGADALEFKSMQIYSDEGKKDFTPQNSRFNRYTAKKKIRSIRCFRLWSHLVYTSDGVVVPCCFDKIPEYPFAIKETHAMEIWRSDGFMQFRKETLKKRNTPPICSNCIH